MGTGSSKTAVQSIDPHEGSSEQSYPRTNSTFTSNSTTNSQSDGVGGGGGQNNNKSFGGYDLAPPLIPPLPSHPPQGTQERKESKNPLSFLGRAFGKGDKNDKKNKRNNRKVVDLDSSDSDTDTDAYEESRRGFDNKLKNDIEDLESTFVRLGLDENGRVREDRGGNTVPGIIGGNSLNLSNSKGRAIRLEKIPQNQNGGIGLTPARDVGYPPSSDSDRSSELNNSMRPQSRGQHNGLHNGRMEKSSLKFSWDQDKPIVEKEDRWTLSKVKIDGFDPEKFRVANALTATNNHKQPASILFIQPTNNNNTGRHEQYNSLPGAISSPSVPRYDPMEQQLLASIERELDW